MEYTKDMIIESMNKCLVSLEEFRLQVGITRVRARNFGAGAIESLMDDISDILRTENMFGRLKAGLSLLSDNKSMADIESSHKITSAEEDTHPEFHKLNDDEFNKLKGPVEDALDELMLKKHFGLDKDVYDETVKYIIEMFGEDSLKPSDAKAAVADWYNDTKQFFPEMFGKGEKRKIASAAYLKKIRSSRYIKSSRKPIKSSKIKDGDKITPEMAEKFTGYVTAFEPLNTTYSYDLRRMVIEKGIGVSFTNGPGGYMFIIDPNRLEEFYDCLKRTCRNFDKNLIERNISKYDTHDFIGCRIYY